MLDLDKPPVSTAEQEEKTGRSRLEETPDLLGDRERDMHRAFTVAAATTFTAPAVAGTAHAASPKYHGSDYGYVNGSTAVACDREADGNGVFTQVDFYGSQATRNFWDGTGADSECGVYGGVTNVYLFRVCEDHVGCTYWYRP
jgi:hypothetical protein